MCSQHHPQSAVCSLAAFATLVLVANAAAEPPSRLDRAQYHVNRGEMHFDREEWAQGLASYLLALELAPENAGLYWNIAQAHEQLGDTERALEYLRRIEGMAVTDLQAAAVQAKMRALQPLARPTARAEPEPARPEPEPAPSQELLMQTAPLSAGGFPLDPVLVTGVVPAANPMRVAGWSTFGVGAGLLVAGIALSVAGQTAYGEVSDAPVHNGVRQMSQVEADRLQQRGDDLSVSGIVLLSIGGAAVAGGLLTALLATDDGPALQVSAPSAGAGLTMGVRGTF